MVGNFEYEDPARQRIICAFCLRTSAGVRIKQDTSSASADAALWMIGCGIRGDEYPFKIGLACAKRSFAPSYMVKKAPAAHVRIQRVRSMDMGSYMRGL